MAASRAYTEEDRGHVASKILERVTDLKWGSVEVIVQDGRVTQISTREIEKVLLKDE